MTRYDEMKAAGSSDDSILAQMKADGFSILDAIKMVRSVFDLSLGEAKEKVAMNENWVSVHQANRDVHEQAISLLQSEPNER